MDTIPEIYIVESLTFKDEDEDRFEGRRLSSMLSLSGKKCKYVYLRTRKELENVMLDFERSNFRYLHLSCHGNSTALGTTLDTIPFPELDEIIAPYLDGR